MGDFFTQDQINSWNGSTSEDVDVLEEEIVNCPPGFQKNSEGKCVEIAATPPPVVEETVVKEKPSSNFW
mgnify:FL=1